MQGTNVFAGPYLDRASHLRGDETWFERALADPDSRLVPVWNSRSLVVSEPPRACYLPLAALPPERRRVDDLVLLGRIGERHVFACGFEGVQAPSLGSDSRFEDLRTIVSRLPAVDAGVLGYARAMIAWRTRHAFCGTCGHKTVATRAGHVLMCTNPSCRHEQYPRLDPAIIVLINDGDRALLGRQAAWPPGRYSTIAGFVEPGESLEDAVAREVLEETGVEVGRIEYFASQPWPFPASLMLGFIAQATTSTVQSRDDELEDVRWFSRAEIEAGTPALPPRQSISYRLIEHWFDSGAGARLRDLQGDAEWPAATR